MNITKGDTPLFAEEAFADREDRRDDSPAMPDGVGLSIDAVRTILFKDHGFALDKDDPTLAVVAINNAFLHEVHKLLTRHEAALRACMGEATEGTVKAIQDEARLFAADFKEAAIQNTLLKVGEHQRSMGEFLGALEGHLHTLKLWSIISLGVSVGFLLTIVGALIWLRQA